MNGPDHTLLWPNGAGEPGGIGNASGRTWGDERFTGVDEAPPADLFGGLASLKFITNSLRRRARLWCTTAAIGLVAGCGLYVLSPPSYQASVTVWLTPGPYENINTAANNDQAMARTRTVAGSALQELGLQQSPASFLNAYKVTPITERVMVITVSALSSDQAVRDANAIASAFLKFRAQEMQTEQALVLASLNQQADQAQQHLNSIDSQIAQVQSLSGSSALQAQLKTLKDEQSRALADQYQARQAVTGNQAANGSATTAAVKGSDVLDPATPLPHSRLKPLVLKVAIGFFAGLFLGMAIVVLQALGSDKLRRRDDVAQALGSPVRLSVGRVRPKPRLASLGGSAARDVDVRRIVAHLGSAVTEGARGAATLAVVPVDDLQVPASALVSLAVAWARDGKHVAVADLCKGFPAARLLGAKKPGVRVVSAYGTQLVVAVPEPDDLMPFGPLDRGSAAAQRSSFTSAVADACASANLLLTLATVDPSAGGEHLATWATDAVAVVTAGRSSWEKIHGAAELVRLSGTHLASAVLIRADKTDESVGVIRTPETV